MNPNLEIALIEFIANEYHLPAETLSTDTNFKIDLNLSADEISSLFQRLQDALSFTLPDDKIQDIETIGDIIYALTPEKDHPSLEDKFL